MLKLNEIKRTLSCRCIENGNCQLEDCIALEMIKSVTAEDALDCMFFSRCYMYSIPCVSAHLA